MRKKWVWVALAVIMVVALYYREHFLRSVFHWMPHDSIEYDKLVRQFFATGVYGYKSAEPNAYVTPGFPLIMAVVYKIVDYTVRDPLPFLRHLNALFSLINLFLIFQIGRKWAGDLVGLLAALISAIYLPFIWANGAILTEVPGTLALTLYLYVQLIAFESRKLSHAFAAGVLLGLTAMIRPEFMPLCVPLYLFYWLQTKDHQFWKPLLAALVGVVLVMSPWWIRNVVTLDKLVLTATQTNPFYAGTFPDKNYSDHLVETRGKTESEIAMERLKVGFTQHTWTFVKWFTVGKLDYTYSKMFFGGGHEPIYTNMPMRTAERLHTFIIWSGLLGMILSLRRWRQPLAVLAVVIVVMSGVRLLFVPEYRYNFTVMPLFILFSAYAVVTVLQWGFSGLVRKPHVS